MPPPNPSAVRSERLVCFAAALAVIALGLVWRWPALALSPFVQKYGADALWAALVFLLIRFLRPPWPVWKSACAAFAFSVAVEFINMRMRTKAVRPAEAHGGETSKVTPGH